MWASICFPNLPPKTVRAGLGWGIPLFSEFGGRTEIARSLKILKESWVEIENVLENLEKKQKEIFFGGSGQKQSGQLETLGVWRVKVEIYSRGAG